MDRGELKRNAKKSLRGNYGSAILVLLVLGILTGLPAMIPPIFQDSSEQTQNIVIIIVSLISVFISSLLTLGAISFFMKVSRNKKVDFGELFNKTGLWVTCLVAMIMISIFTSLWTLLLVIPGIIAAYRYRLTPYVIVDNPGIGGIDAITKSKELMKGYKMDLFVLDLSFIGWNILAVCTLGLLYFWLAPYMNTTYANFYNEVKKLKKSKK